MIRDLKNLLAAVVLVCLAASASAAPCVRPTYPPQALRQSEEGVSLLGFLIRADGTVARSVVLGSSGSAALDQEAADSLSRCTFIAGKKDGKPVQIWVAVTYVWALDSDLGLNRPKQSVELAASKDDPAARYQLSLLFRATAKTGAERERAEALLRSAAELGHAHAQFELGRDLEQGLNGNPKDVDAAMSWYRKAAAQGDVFALQRLEEDRS
jgi:TonB family protein